MAVNSLTLAPAADLPNTNGQPLKWWLFLDLSREWNSQLKIPMNIALT